MFKRNPTPIIIMTMPDASPIISLGRFPQTRLRRWRQWNWSRNLISETNLTPADLIWPAFVREGNDTHRETIDAMPGVIRHTIDQLVEAVGRAIDLGIPAIALFPRTDPSLKTDDGAEALNPDNLICRSMRA